MKPDMSDITPTVKVPVLIEYQDDLSEFKASIISLRRGLLAQVQQCNAILDRIAERERHLTQKQG